MGHAFYRLKLFLENCFILLVLLIFLIYYFLIYIYVINNLYNYFYAAVN